MEWPMFLASLLPSLYRRIYEIRKGQEREIKTYDHFRDWHEDQFLFYWDESGGRNGSAAKQGYRTAHRSVS